MQQFVIQVKFGFIKMVTGTHAVSSKGSPGSTIDYSEMAYQYHYIIRWEGEPLVNAKVSHTPDPNSKKKRRKGGGFHT
jgi:hypothetical protein